MANTEVETRFMATFWILTISTGSWSPPTYQTLSQIAKGLNDDGIPSPAKYKHRKGILYNGRIVDNASIWTNSTISRILKDERYTGKMITHKRETDGITAGRMIPVPKEAWIVVPNTHEAIVTQEIFDAATAVRSGRIKTVNQNTAGHRPDNLFVCGYCGRKLQKAYGSVTHLYCLKARVYSNSPCAAIHEPLEALQGQVLEVINKMATVLVNRIAEIKIDVDQEIPSVEKKISEVEIRLQRLQTGKLDLYEKSAAGNRSASFFTGPPQRPGRIAQEKIQANGLHGIRRKGNSAAS